MAAFILPIISGLAGLFGNKNKTSQESKFNTTENVSGQQTASTRPDLNPLQQRLIDMFSQGAQNMYQRGLDTSGYQATGLRNINDASDIQQKLMENILAQRGLSYSPAAATSLSGIEQGRAHEISQFMNSIPLLQRQMQQQDIGQLMQAFGAQPYGSTQTGTSNQTINRSGTQTGATTQSGSPWAGLFGGLGAGLAGPSSGGSGSNLDAILKSFGFGGPGGPKNTPTWQGTGEQGYGR